MSYEKPKVKQLQFKQTLAQLLVKALKKSSAQNLWRWRDGHRGFLILGCSLLMGCTNSPLVEETVNPINPSSPNSPTPAIVQTPIINPATTPAITSQIQMPTMTPGNRQPQSLPIAAKITIGDQVIDLEVAGTPQEQEMGLMFRTDLPADRGMIFPFTPARPVGFWMKNTLIPLDMVFLRDGVIREIIANVPPCGADPCPSYGPPFNVDIDQVIELRSGRAEELGLRRGDRLPVEFLP